MHLPQLAVIAMSLLSSKSPPACIAPILTGLPPGLLGGKRHQRHTAPLAAPALRRLQQPVPPAPGVQGALVPRGWVGLIRIDELGLLACCTCKLGWHAPQIQDATVACVCGAHAQTGTQSFTETSTKPLHSPCLCWPPTTMAQLSTTLTTCTASPSAWPHMMRSRM